LDIEQFSKGDSFLHRLDPRVKIIVTLFFSVVVATTTCRAVTIIAFFLPATAILVARLDLKKVGWRLMIVNGFVLFLWFFLPFTYPGQTIFSLGPLKASREGIEYALLITLKSNAIILASIAFLATTPVPTLIHALNRLRLPGKLVHMAFFCYRYIHVIHLEYHSIVNALKIRCFRPGTNLHTYRTYAYLVGILLLRSFDRSKRIYNAMLCRGFKGKYWIVDHLSLKRSDLFLGVALSAYIIGLILFQWKLMTR
jgi:cobalt/nickel transport system permease protein